MNNIISTVSKIIFFSLFSLLLPSNTFALVNPIARQLWKFQRYDVTMNYEQKPLLVPPLVLFHHVFHLFKFLVCRCKRFRRQSRLDRGLSKYTRQSINTNGTVFQPQIYTRDPRTCAILIPAWG